MAEVKLHYTVSRIKLSRLPRAIRPRPRKEKLLIILISYDHWHIANATTVSKVSEKLGKSVYLDSCLEITVIFISYNSQLTASYTLAITNCFHMGTLSLNDYFKLPNLLQHTIFENY